MWDSPSISSAGPGCPGQFVLKSRLGVELPGASSAQPSQQQHCCFLLVFPQNHFPRLFLQSQGILACRCGESWCSPGCTQTATAILIFIHPERLWVDLMTATSSVQITWTRITLAWVLLQRTHFKKWINEDFYFYHQWKKSFKSWKTVCFVCCLFHKTLGYFERPIKIHWRQNGILKADVPG